MIVAVDVHYWDEQDMAQGALVGFRGWSDETEAFAHTCLHSGVEPYEPGRFWKRELPVVMKVLCATSADIDAIVVDGYVDFDGNPAMGWRLWANLGGVIPVIGVAKNRFRDTMAQEVLRGQSASPLFVTAIGIDVAQAAGCIAQMHGQYRIPTLLKSVDQLARTQPNF